MLEPWNNRTLLPPPVHTCQCMENVDVKSLKRVCSNAIHILTKQSPLHNESAILSRFLYKFDKKFRSDIGYRILKKVNTTLRKYLMLDIIKDMENFKMVLPSDDENLSYLPTRQMLEYLLVRLVTLSKLMLRISICCKQAAIFYLDRVKRGESHWMSMMPYALLSRIWSLSNVLLQHSCTWYIQMYPFLTQLQLKGVPFLPKRYELPENLEQWLDLKNHENFGRFQWSRKDIVKIDPTLIEDNESDKLDNLLMYINEINKDDEQLNVKLQLKTDTVQVLKPEILTGKQVDKGEAISRESFKNFYAKPEKLEVKHYSYYHSIDRVTNKQTLQEFIDREESLRYEESNKSLTSQLSFMQWQALKTSMLKLCDSLNNNRKIQRKFLKLWQEKCLDCS